MNGVLNLTENIIMAFFAITLAFGGYMILYFFSLRFRGIITSGYRITSSVFDEAIRQTNDQADLKKLNYGKKIYFIFLYTFFVAMGLMIVLVLWIDPA